MTIIDASFANNDDLSLHLGHILIFTDSLGCRNVISYAIFISKCIVRSMLKAETYAFADYFDQAYIICGELLGILLCKVPSAMPTDSTSLFNVTIRSSKTWEQRLMIDLVAAREAFDRREIYGIW